jgi:hypothetical protein
VARQYLIRPSADMDAAGRGADMAARLGPRLVKLLALAGHDTVDKLRVASDEALLEVIGVTEADLQLIREVVG